MRCPAQDLARWIADLDAGAVLRAAAPVDLPPDAGAEHAVRAAPAGAARRRHGQRHARPHRRAHRRRRPAALRGLGLARPGHRCAHNLNYWQFGDYLGIGAGAHGKLSFPHRVVRQVKWREPARYMAEALAGRALSNEDEVARAALPFEFMLNALRLRDGFALQDFRDRTGLPLSAIEPALAEAQRRGLLTADLTHARPTAHGFDFLSDLQQLFL
jgi:coproporphyrinogen III oxidase-like Fe-S oxidoreductase